MTSDMQVPAAQLAGKTLQISRRSPCCSTATRQGAPQAGDEQFNELFGLAMTKLSRITLELELRETIGLKRKGTISTG